MIDGYDAYKNQQDDLRELKELKEELRKRWDTIKELNDQLLESQGKVAHWFDMFGLEKHTTLEMSKEIERLMDELNTMTKEKNYFHDLNEEIIEMMKGKDLRIRKLEKEVKLLEATDRNNNIIIKTAAERVEGLQEALALDRDRLADAIKQVERLEAEVEELQKLRRLTE